MGGQKSNRSQNLKYLIVLIDEHLNWKAQISFLCSKLRRANGALSKVCHHVPSNVLLNIYHALFSSHMMYAFSFGVELKTLTLVVFLCYRNVLFFLCPFPNHVPLRVLYLLKLLNILLVHQHLNSLLPFDLCSTLVFKRIDHLYPTRSQNLALLKLPYANTTTHGLKRLPGYFAVEFLS